MSGNGETTTTRREFLVQTGQTAAGVVAGGALAAHAGTAAQTATSRSTLGANDRINIAVLGIRSRGMQLAEGFAKIPNVRVKTLVDPDDAPIGEQDGCTTVRGGSESVLPRQAIARVCDLPNVGGGAPDFHSTHDLHDSTGVGAFGG